MNLNIIVCSHGRMCEELIKSVEMIGGELKDTVSIPLLPNMSMEDYCDAVKSNLKRECINICFVDLLGGTPCNALLSLSRSYKIEIISGVNLPMLLESTTAMNYETVEEFKEHLLKTYRDSGIDVLKRMEDIYGD